MTHANGALGEVRLEGTGTGQVACPSHAPPLVRRTPFQSSICEARGESRRDDLRYTRAPL